MDSEQLREQVAEIEKSGRLGKSPAYARLLNYLMQRSLDGPPPKEIEIAIEVFGRDGDFDVTQDALVRVYVHKLRKKLKDYYGQLDSDTGFHLEIPRGSYRLEMIVDQVVKPDAGWFPGTSLPVGLVALVLGGLLIWLMLGRGEDAVVVEDPGSRAAQSFLWKGLVGDSRPTLVVLGDLFVFSEINEFSEEVREIRDFGINSEADLDMYLAQNPELAQSYRSFGISFLPPNVALSLRRIMPVLLTSKLDVQTRVVSQLTAEDFTHYNILYVGLLTSLGSIPELRDKVLGHSRFEAHTSYEILVDHEGGDIFAGEGDIGQDYSERFIDYALVSRITSPDGGSILSITGMRDTGLEQVLEALTDPEVLNDLAGQAAEQGVDTEGAFEILYEITGFGLDSLEAMPRSFDSIRLPLSAAPSSE